MTGTVNHKLSNHLMFGPLWAFYWHSLLGDWKNYEQKKASFCTKCAMMVWMVMKIVRLFLLMIFKMAWTIRIVIRMVDPYVVLCWDKKRNYCKGKYVLRHVRFVNVQSSLHKNVVVSVCVRMDNAAYIIFIMWNSISGLDAWYHFRFNISCGVAVTMRGHQKKSGNF